MQANGRVQGGSQAQPGHSMQHNAFAISSVGSTFGAGGTNPNVYTRMTKHTPSYKWKGLCMCVPPRMLVDLQALNKNITFW
jgi:hypothetical protein